ncbi:hypothetical protein [Acinetobacter junii]|uniref:hypothetical protein n=1 Tax=Acinetobacter junii TaxID=40215 RepID=UPI001250C807|nr:hypothetical protein [Acinetobacter junii]
MDIQELNQFESVYQPSKEITFCWGVKKYVQLSVEENHTEIVDHANDSLRIWQAAKAQAVPEGFVLVSQKELMELAIAINAVDLATHTEGKPNEVREMWQQVALKLGALCSTGASQ